MIMILILACLLVTASAVPQTKIVGGHQTGKGSHAHQASLQMLYFGAWYHICGGSLISRNYVLTAAHCVDDSSASYRVVLGDHRLSTSSGDEQATTVQVILHPQYNGNAPGFPNDIALLRLSSPVTIVHSRVDTIPLPPDNSNDFSTNNHCTLSGWGKTDGANSGGADTLKEVSMEPITNSQCSSRWSGVSGATINSGHICVLESGKSACSGDSGGPMVCSGPSHGKLAGVTSWGISTCSGAFPSVYTRVSAFLSWIHSNSDV